MNVNTYIIEIYVYCIYETYCKDLKTYICTYINNYTYIYIYVVMHTCILYEYVYIHNNTCIYTKT